MKYELWKCRATHIAYRQLQSRAKANQRTRSMWTLLKTVFFKQNSRSEFWHFWAHMFMKCRRRTIISERWSEWVRVRESESERQKWTKFRTRILKTFVRCIIKLERNVWHRPKCVLLVHAHRTFHNIISNEWMNGWIHSILFLAIPYFLPMRNLSIYIKCLCIEIALGQNKISCDIIRCICSTAVSNT